MKWSILLLLICKLPLFLTSSVSQQVSEASNQFGWKLLQNLEKVDNTKNVLISPFSISVSLSMAMAGATGGTYKELASMLGFTRPQLTSNDINNGYQNLLHNMALNQNLSVAILFAFQESFPIETQFASVITGHFHAQTLPLDVCHQPENATAQMNSWISEKTNEKIPKLFAKPVEKDTSAVLVNTVYLKGQWEIKFSTKATENLPFYVLPNKTKSVPFLRIKDDFKYAEFADGQLIELLFTDKSLSFYVFLPANHSTDALSLFNENQSFESRITKLQSDYVSFMLPKFKYNDLHSLKATLRQLGISAAFDHTQANFSQISKKNLFINEILHQTTIEVNESGIEAAAATAVRFVFLMSRQFDEKRIVRDPASEV